MPTGGTSFISDPDNKVNKNTAQGHIYTNEAFAIIKNPVKIAISAASGGTQLETIPAAKVVIRNFPNNNVMYVGGNGDDAPYVDHGMDLFPGELYTAPVRNANQIQICAATSGQFIRYQVFLNEQDVNLSTNVEPAYPDLIAPYVLSTIPVNTAVNVVRNGPSAGVQATLSEAVDDTTCTTTNFTINNGTANVSGVVFRDPSNSAVIKWTPLTNLSGSVVHTCTLKTGITDLAANVLSGAPFSWTFTTKAALEGADVTPPTVVSTTPASNATNVATSTTIVAVFSEQMLSSTINTTNFTVIDQSNNPVAGTVSLNATDKITATFTPSSSLTGGVIYTATLKVGCQDLAGNGLAVAYTWSFTTIPPALVQLYAVTGGTASNYLSAAAGDDQREGMIIKAGSSLLGKIPKKIRVQLLKSGSPPGNITAAVRRGTDDSIQTVLGPAISASTLTTAYKDYDFQNLTATYKLVANDKITVEYSSGDTSNRIRVERYGSDVNATANRTRYDGTYHDFPTEDFNCTMWGN